METYNMEDVKEKKWTHATVCCGRRVVGDSTRYNHFMTFFRVEGWAVGHEPKAVGALDVTQALLCNW